MTSCAPQSEIQSSINLFIIETPGPIENSKSRMKLGLIENKPLRPRRDFTRARGLYGRGIRDVRHIID